MIGSRGCVAPLMGALLNAAAGLPPGHARLVTVNSAIDAELNYLLSLVKQDASAIASVPAERLTHILEFVDQSKEPGASYVARDRPGYIDTFGTEEMVSAISLARMKALLGRPHQLPLDDDTAH